MAMSALPDPTDPTDPTVAAAFRATLRRMASTVTIVTASDGERRHGMTMTAVTSLSLDPPSLLICVNRSTLLHEILMGARHFCVNVLRHDQADVSTAFSGAASPETRFFVGRWGTHPLGVDYLDTAQSNVFCRKSAALPYGTHTIFIGAVEDVRAGELRDVSSARDDGSHREQGDDRPLLYCNAAYC